MASRGRSRKRTTRMDAAIDAMTQYGFSEDLVRTQVKELLKAYGGNDGWAFIEDSAYKELLEAIFRHMEANTQEENAEEGKPLENDSSQDRNAEDHALPDAAGPSNAVVVGDEEPISSTVGNNENRDSSAPVKDSCITRSMDRLPPAEGDGKSWKNIGLNQVCRQKETANAVSSMEGNSLAEDLPEKTPIVSSTSVFPSPPLAISYRNYRRPCYGWIDSDGDDDNEFIFLPPAPRLPPARSGKRKSRWDQRAEDP